MHTGGSLKEQHFLLMVHSFIYLTNYYQGLGGRVWLGMHSSHSAPEHKRLRLFHRVKYYKGPLVTVYCVCVKSKTWGGRCCILSFFKKKNKTQHDYILIYKQGGRWEGGSGWGTCVHPWWIHVDVWQNQYNIVK